MAHFADGRSKERTKDDAARTAFVTERRAQLSRFLENLRQDDRFYDYVKEPFVVRAIEHWTGHKRVKNDPQFVERINSDPMTLYVFRNIVQLNKIVTQAQVKFPLHELLQRRKWGVETNISAQNRGEPAKVADAFAPSRPKNIEEQKLVHLAITVAIICFLIRFCTTDIWGDARYPSSLNSDALV